MFKFVCRWKYLNIVLSIDRLQMYNIFMTLHNLENLYIFRICNNDMILKYDILKCTFVAKKHYLFYSFVLLHCPFW